MALSIFHFKATLALEKMSLPPPPPIMSRLRCILRCSYTFLNDYVVFDLSSIIKQINSKVRKR